MRASLRHSGTFRVRWSVEIETTTALRRAAFASAWSQGAKEFASGTLFAQAWIPRNCFLLLFMPGPRAGPRAGPRPRGPRALGGGRLSLEKLRLCSCKAQKHGDLAPFSKALLWNSQVR